MVFRLGHASALVWMALREDEASLGKLVCAVEGVLVPGDKFDEGGLFTGCTQAVESEACMGDGDAF